MLPRSRFERLFNQIVESLNMQSLSHPELLDLTNENTGFLVKFESQINTNNFFSDKNIITDIARGRCMLKKESLSET